jgi:hypothetical protein
LPNDAVIRPRLLRLKGWLYAPIFPDDASLSVSCIFQLFGGWRLVNCIQSDRRFGQGLPPPLLSNPPLEGWILGNFVDFARFSQSERHETSR